ncbi:MAG: organomercurial lyase [Actinomycetia bacterium]|nr:organomercurial lyase [Actinomycetes bacterium]
MTQEDEISLEVRDAYRKTLLHFIETGRAPHYTELSISLGVPPETALALQRGAAEVGVGSWMLANTDYVECWAPFSNVPTQHLISVDGEQRWYGQCGLEALAASYMFPGKAVTIDSRCVDCADSVSVTVRGDEILNIDPPEAVGHMNEQFAKGEWNKDRSASHL